MSKILPGFLLCTAILTGCGGSSGSDTTVIVENKAPSVSVNNTAGFETEAISLTAVASDEDGSIAQYSWVQVGGTAVTFTGGTSATITFTAPAVTADQILSFRVTVTDDKGKSNTADGLVTVKFNQAPVVTAANVVVDEQSTGSVVAEISDTDGSISSISWLQVSGPQVVLTGANTATLSFTAPNVQQDTELQFSVTATDNLGKSSSATSNVSVKTTDVSYSIEGVVTDAPIANAVVTAEVGGITYTTTANANGEYALEIKLATDAGDELIILTATSPGSAAVLFHSVLGTADDIRAASNDTTLNSAELFATNITNVSSAFYALLALANNGDVPTTKTAMLQAALNMEGELVLPFAVAVKLVLDYSVSNVDLALPAQFDTVAQWLVNRDAVLDYINKAKLNYQYSYEEAESAIKADVKLVKPLSSIGSLVGRYYIDRTLGDLGVAQFVLHENQTGEWSQVEAGGAFSWSIADAGIVLDFGTPGLQIDRTPIYEFDYGETTTYLQKVTLAVIGETSQSIQFAMDQQKLSVAGEQRNFEEVVKTTSETVKAFKQDAVMPALDYIKPNTDYALPFAGIPSTYLPEALIQNANSSVRTAKLRLVADSQTSGTAYFTAYDYAEPNQLESQLGNYPWQLNADGQIVITLSETDYVEISSFSVTTSADNPFVSVKSAIDNVSRAISFPALAQSNTVWTTMNIPGIYQLPVDPLDINNLFWLELNADGTALTVTAYDANNNGELEVGENQIMPGFWQLDDNGDLHVRRYRRNVGGTGYCQPTQWQPTAEDSCQLFNDRTMKLINLSEAKSDGSKDVALIIDHRFYDSYKRGGDTGQIQLGYDLLAYGLYYNAIWQKVSERPVELE